VLVVRITESVFTQGVQVAKTHHTNNSGGVLETLGAVAKTNDHQQEQRREAEEMQLGSNFQYIHQTIQVGQADQVGFFCENIHIPSVPNSAPFMKGRCPSFMYVLFQRPFAAYTMFRK
jgi:hypothetical protein